METRNTLKSALSSHLKRFGLDGDNKDRFVAELDVLSNLIIDYYLNNLNNKE